MEGSGEAGMEVVMGPGFLGVLGPVAVREAGLALKTHQYGRVWTLGTVGL